MGTMLYIRPLVYGRMVEGPLTGRGCKAEA